MIDRRCLQLVAGDIQFNCRAPEVPGHQLGEGVEDSPHGEGEPAPLHVEGIPAHLVVTQEPLVVEPDNQAI